MNQTPYPNDKPGHSPAASGWSTPEQWPGDDRANDPRDPGSPLRALFAWVFTLLLIALVVVSNVMSNNAAPTAAASHSPGGLDTLFGRYVVGAGVWFGAANPELPTELNAQFVESFAQSPDGKLRAAIIASELDGPAIGLTILNVLDAELATSDEPDPAIVDQDAPAADTDAAPDPTSELQDLSATLRVLYTAGPDALTTEQRAALVTSQGWFGELALTRGLDESDPARAAVIRPAKRVVVTLFVVGALAFVTLICGVALFIVAVVLYTNGRIRRAYARAAPGGSVYLETFAAFILCFILVSFIAAEINKRTNSDVSSMLVWALVVVPFLPLALGVPWVKHKFAMGFHRGRGVVREVFAGVVGYVAGFPIVAVGILCTLLLGALLAALREMLNLPPAPPASHPIVDQIRARNPYAILGVYALACVWAPVVEESIFRGALYHHLRARANVILSALIVAFLFAVIHPQGIAAVPALMSLAVVFALLREWRGSLIAPITAHALHNGVLVTVMIVALA